MLRSPGSTDSKYGIHTSDPLKKGMLIKIEQDLFRILDCSTSPRQPARIRPREDAQHPQRHAGRIRSCARKTSSSARRSTSARCSISTTTATTITSWTRQLRAGHISSEALGDSVNYLKPEMTIQVEFYGEEPVGIELPQTVDLKVMDTARHQGRDGEQAGQAGDARNRPGRAGAAVRQHRRHDPRQHRDRRIPVAPDVRPRHDRAQYGRSWQSSSASSPDVSGLSRAGSKSSSAACSAARARS